MPHRDGVRAVQVAQQQPGAGGSGSAKLRGLRAALAVPGIVQLQLPVPWVADDAALARREGLLGAVDVKRRTLLHFAASQDVSRCLMWSVGDVVAGHLHFFCGNLRLPSKAIP